VLKRRIYFLKVLFIAAQLHFFHYAFVLLCYNSFANPFPSGLRLSVKKTLYTEKQTATDLQENLTTYMSVHPAEEIKQFCTIIE
jgi:hypothetical protein